MQGDFSRLTFDPTKQYSGVRMQQGRVQLDADWNEQMDILMHRLETEVADFIGASGVPADVNSGNSFQVTVAGNELQVAPGRIYLAGKLFENASSKTMPADQLPQENGEYIAYLDAWQSVVSALEDPAIREVALGGADTTVRVKNVWRVRFAKSTAGAPVAPTGMVRTTGKLRAQHDGSSALGNQLYRVEIHTGGAAGVATYKWSRENGAVATTLEAIDSPAVIRVASAGRDNRLGFEVGQWVELLTPQQAQQGEAGALIQIQAVNGRTLTLAKDLPQEITSSESQTSVIVRRWEGTGTIPTESSPTESSPLLLENGITISFQGQGATYMPGDYWLIPTRALTGKLEWPGDFQPPQGIRHYYTRLASLRRGGSGSWGSPEDLRITFKPQDKGFVSKGGDTMSGPLSISVQGDTTVALHVQGTTNLEGPLTVNGALKAQAIFEAGIALDNKYQRQRPYYPLYQPQWLHLDWNEFSGGFTDGRYGYLVPSGHNNLVRVDLTTFPDRTSVTTLDLGMKGFRGGFTDGRYGYLVPWISNTRLVRVDLTNFSAIAIDDILRLENVVLDNNLGNHNNLDKGFNSGFTDGRYGYLVPVGHTNLVRADLTTFTPTGVATLDLDMSGFWGGFTDGRYGYLVPASDRKLVRVDLTTFKDVATLDLDMSGFWGGFTDGRYGYLVPTQHGNLVRVDLTTFTPTGVATLDLDMSGFRGGFTDGRYGYLVPSEHGNLVRVDLTTFTPTDVATLDLGEKRFWGGFTDGRYGYLVPTNGELGRIMLFNGNSSP